MPRVEVVTIDEAKKAIASAKCRKWLEKKAKEFEWLAEITKMLEQKG